MAERVEIDIIARTEKAVAGLKNLVAGLAKTYLSWRAIKEAVEFTVKAYMEQEEAARRLSAALKITGQESVRSTESLAKLASELQSVTTFGDEATMSAMGMLIQLGGLTEKGVKKAIPLIQDFAAVMGMDLNQAAELFAKTIGSNTNALARYGIQVEGSLPPQEKMAKLLEQMQKKMGGFAKELKETTSGQIISLKNQLGDLAESAGSVIVTILNPVTKWLNVQIGKINQVIADAMSINQIGQKWTKGESLSPEEAVKYFTFRIKAAQDQMKDVVAKSAQGIMFGKYEDPNETRKKLQEQIDGWMWLVDQAKKKIEDRNKVDEGPDVLAGFGGEGASKTVSETIDALYGLDAAFRNLSPAMEDFNARWKAMGNMAWGGWGAPEIDKTAASINDLASRWEALGQAYESMTVDFENAPTFNFLGGSTPEEMEKFYRDQEAYVAELQSKWLAIADAAVQFGTALASGDVTGALAGIIQQASQAAIAWAVPAAAKAYAAGDMANFAYFMGIAGVGVLGSIFAGVMKQGGKAEVSAMAEGGIVTSPRLALIGEKGPEAVVPLGKGVGGNTIIVQGSVWSERDLAKAIAGVQARW